MRGWWATQQGFPSSPFAALQGPQPLALGLLLRSRNQEDLAYIFLLLHLPHGICHLERKRRPFLMLSAPPHRARLKMAATIRPWILS